MATYSFAAASAVPSRLSDGSFARGSWRTNITVLTAHGVASFGLAARPGSAGTADLVPTLDVERA